MAEIISFAKHNSNAGKKAEKNRWKALVEGTLETYRCNSCEEEFEVIDDNRPDRCPHCGLRIEWV